MSLVRGTLETPDSGLNREQFALSLRLVAAAQASLVLIWLRTFFFGHWLRWPSRANP